jgi:hypothetical protein
MAVKQITRKQLVTKARKTQRGGSGRSGRSERSASEIARATHQQIDQNARNVITQAERIRSLFQFKKWLVELKEQANVSQNEVTQKAGEITRRETEYGTPLQLIQKLETAVQDLRTFINSISN